MPGSDRKARRRRTLPPPVTPDPARELTTVQIHGIAHGGAGIGHATDPRDAPAQPRDSQQSLALPDAPPNHRRDAPQGTAQGARESAPPLSDRRVWLVDGAIPGDTVLAEPIQAKTRMVRAQIRSVVHPADDRVAPPCPRADRCGGCGWQHVRVGAQAQLKARIVADLLRKLGVAIDTVVPSPAPLGYRRRARMHFEQAPGGLQIGFFARGGRELVHAPDCPVLDGALQHALQRIRCAGPLLPVCGVLHALSDGERAVLGLAAQAELRLAPHDHYPVYGPPGLRSGQRVAMPPVVGDDATVRAGFAALLDDVLVGIAVGGPRGGVGVGRQTLTIDCDEHGLGLDIGPFGFAQAQAAQNAALVAHVLGWADGSPQRRGLELFAGAGNFTRGLLRRVRSLCAVETDRAAVASLHHLAGHQAIRAGTRLTVLREPAAAMLARAAARGDRYDLVVLDPPRAGLGQAAVRDLAKVATRRTIYIACDPATLARDLTHLVELGHRIHDLAVFDMMPMTPDVEVVAVLERRPEAAWTR